MKGYLVTAVTNSPGNQIGFLSIFQEASGFVGGYLVTNSWGRPLEFRLSSAVQPSKVQQILYGDSLHSYLCEVIGKTLIEKTASPANWLLIDNPLALALRRTVETPIGLWYSIVDPEQPPPGLIVQSRLYCHAEYPDDLTSLREQIQSLGTFDFAEPFARIREALQEARKLGIASRAA
jgi:hypothetical protein